MNKLINVLLILLFFVSCDNTENQGDIVSENDECDSDYQFTYVTNSFVIIL